MKKDRLTLSTAQYFALRLQIRAEQLKQEGRSYTPTPTKERTQRKHFYLDKPEQNNQTQKVTHREKKHFQNVKLTQSPDLAHRQRRHYQAPKDSFKMGHPSDKERVRFYRKNPE